MTQHYYKLRIGILCLGLFIQIKAFSQALLQTLSINYTSEGCAHMPSLTIEDLGPGSSTPLRRYEVCVFVDNDTTNHCYKGKIDHNNYPSPPTHDKDWEYTFVFRHGSADCSPNDEIYVTDSLDDDGITPLYSTNIQTSFTPASSVTPGVSMVNGQYKECYIIEYNC